MKILVADDGLTSRTMLSAAINGWGHETITAADGNEVWAIMQKDNAPKLLILDWMMPGINGVELCRKLRSKMPNDAIYIILLTSKSNPQDIAEGLEAGADDYIIKPFENLELRARVNVGIRILTLSEEKLEPEKNRCAIDAIDEICQEMVQPMQSVLGWSEMLLMDLPESDINYKTLKTIKEGVGQIGSLTKRIMAISSKQKK
ncbi:PleD family two-component system response regulator [Methanolobus vulcani]|uniref:Response regulator transcription factor n=1 Tax=Methanolobus vulcani TaxID=38026 RepID=A0A7Z8KM98_9EURY|nr:response regulator transcription factor [Methanolobus vulcani]TQD24368.1 response regulator transcription factor [Methanolobus vulcani]